MLTQYNYPSIKIEKKVHGFKVIVIIFIINIKICNKPKKTSVDNDKQTTVVVQLNDYPIA